MARLARACSASAHHLRNRSTTGSTLPTKGMSSVMRLLSVSLLCHLLQTFANPASFSVNGVEGTCCPLCGTLNQWNIQVCLALLILCVRLILAVQGFKKAIRGCSGIPGLQFICFDVSLKITARPRQSLGLACCQ